MTLVGERVAPGPSVLAAREIVEGLFTALLAIFMKAAALPAIAGSKATLS
jgi:hypothetical protein